MDPCDGYDISKQKKVIVTNRSLGKERRIICYDDGDGVTKEEDGFLWVRTRHILTGTPGVWSKAKWERIAPISTIEYTIADEEEYAE
ncbi:MAG: hypothetical protein GQ565_12595 [Candidatus Aegiribacteria sp.]|nr:hypothetical protein [Candidatus Aegiribacteria sp.]